MSRIWRWLFWIWVVFMVGSVIQAHPQNLTEFVARMVFTYLMYIAPIQLVAWLFRSRKKKLPEVVASGSEEENKVANHG
jgi:hypothetical protein